MSASISTTILIQAPTERVWPLLSNVADWPLWLPTMTAVHPLDGPDLAPAARYQVIQPKLPPATWTVIRLEPGISFAWESRSPGVRTVADHVLLPMPDGSTTVTLRIEFSGPFAFVARLLFGTLTKEYISREAALLKEGVEGGRRPDRPQ